MCLQDKEKSLVLQDKCNIEIFFPLQTQISWLQRVLIFDLTSWSGVRSHTDFHQHAESIPRFNVHRKIYVSLLMLGYFAGCFVIKFLPNLVLSKISSRKTLRVSNYLDQNHSGPIFRWTWSGSKLQSLSTARRLKMCHQHDKDSVSPRPF